MKVISELQRLPDGYVQVQVKVAPETLQRCREKAKGKGWPVTILIRDYIDLGLEIDDQFEEGECDG